MAHRSHMLMIAPIALALAACGAKTSTLGLRVVDDAGRPLSHARVRVVPIGTSDIPLPVSRETLGEAFAKTQRGATTDERGEVVVTVLSERVHHVQVVPRPGGSDAHPTGVEPALVFVWVLTTEPRTVTPWSHPPNPPGIRLELAGEDRGGG